MSHVTFEDGVWSNVYCDKCKHAHKLLTRRMRGIYDCPYCGKTIKLVANIVEKAVAAAKGE